MSSDLSLFIPSSPKIDRRSMAEIKSGIQFHVNEVINDVIDETVRVRVDGEGKRGFESRGFPFESLEFSRGV